ncbi:MAG: signal peptidase II [Candidatus Margulisiibacteriota bacterium]
MTIFSKGYTRFIVLGFIIDQITKMMAQTNLSFFEPTEVIPNVLQFQLVNNFGAAYGILQNQRFFLLGIGLIVLAGCYVFRSKLGTSTWSRLGLSFLMIGIAGNVFDRLWRGFVIDFIDIHVIPVFNLADVCINIGMALFILELFAPRGTQKHRRRR